MVCPKCYARGMVKFGLYKGEQKWHCMDCHLTTIHPRTRVPKRQHGGVEEESGSEG